MKASRRLVEGDFVVNDVSRHARMRCKERGLALESLSGHARGVKAVFSPRGKVKTVYSKVVKPNFLRGIESPMLFRDEAHFGADRANAPAPACERVDATGLVPYVVGKGAATIKRVCEKHGVSVTVDCNRLNIEGGAAHAAAAAAEFEGIIDRKRRALLRALLRWDGTDVVEVDVAGYVGHVIGKLGVTISILERKFNVYINIDGATARILPVMSSAADADGARAAIEALKPKSGKS